jgi:hypothetical protein
MNGRLWIIKNLELKYAIPVAEATTQAGRVESF